LVFAFLLFSFSSTVQALILQPTTLNVVNNGPSGALDGIPDILRPNDFTFNGQVTGLGSAFSIGETFLKFDICGLTKQNQSICNLDLFFSSYGLSGQTKRNQSIFNLNLFYSDYDGDIGKTFSVSTDPSTSYLEIWFFLLLTLLLFSIPLYRTIPGYLISLALVYMILCFMLYLILFSPV
jgi:hypothetical protein